MHEPISCDAMYGQIMASFLDDFQCLMASNILSDAGVTDLSDAGVCVGLTSVRNRKGLFAVCRACLVWTRSVTKTSWRELQLR